MIAVNPLSCQEREEAMSAFELGVGEAFGRGMMAGCRFRVKTGAARTVPCNRYSFSGHVGTQCSIFIIHEIHKKRNESGSEIHHGGKRNCDRSINNTDTYIY